MRSREGAAHQNGQMTAPGEKLNGEKREASEVRIGVIGCGYWGPQLIRNVEQAPSAVLAAVADTRLDRLDYVRRQHPGVPVYTDYREMLEADIDAVVVATPIATHHPIAREVLLSGRHVLVEKPMTTSVNDALDLLQVAGEQERLVMAGHTFVFNPAVQELRRLVQSGELGRVHYVDGARLNLGLFQRNVNVIWDLAPHDVSILLYVLGRQPVAVSARGSCCVQRDVHDVAYIEIQFDGGITAQIHVSWLDPAKVRRMTIVGNQRMAVYDDVSLDEKIRVYDKGVDTPMTDSFGEFQLSYRYGQVTIPYIAWQEPLRLEVEHFVQCVRTGEAPRSDGLQGLAVAAVLEAANISLQDSGRRVPVHIRAIPVDQRLNRTHKLLEWLDTVALDGADVLAGEPAAS